MKVHRLIRTPGGEIPATLDILNEPYRLSLASRHRRCTLGDYFDAVEDFMVRDHLKAVAEIPGGSVGRTVPIRDITDIRIRSEKHGAVYHVASMEVCAGAGRVKLAVSAAVTQEAKQWLAAEWETLKLLHENLGMHIRQLHRIIQDLPPPAATAAA